MLAPPQSMLNPLSSNKSIVTVSFMCVFATLLFGGCGKQSPSGTANTTSSPETNAAAPQNSQVTSGPGPGEKVCFACNGTGIVACHAPGCKNGKVDCPGGCLKLSQGNWTRQNVAGHDPNELWISFHGKSGTTSWSQGHVGQVIVYQNGDPVNIGTCKVCGGSTTVSCPVCKGQGTQACEICSGKKFIPAAWSPTDNPWFNKQPDLIRLTDGKVLLGRIAGMNGDDRTIVTRDKKVVHVKASDIVTSPGTKAASTDLHL
jgi:hypothetical protein